MKKFFLFASAALVLASCSSEAEEAVIKPNETPEEEVLELTQIKLGAGAPTASAETRAVVDIEGAFNDTKVGIFGVNENGSATNNDWSTGASRNNMNIAAENAVILSNEAATIASNGEVNFDAVSSNGVPTNKIYFPRTNNNEYGYTFLGYYPRVETVASNTDNIVVSGKFDGTQDIIAGKSLSATPVSGSQIGYNAKYIRDWRADIGGGSGYPTIDIAFKHLTSKINIQLRKTTNYIQEMCDVYAAWFEVQNDYSITFAQDASNNSVTTALAFSGSPVNAYALGGGEFDPAKEYKNGDVVRYQDKYYKFNNDHTGNWTGNDAPETSATAPEESSFTKYPIFIEPDPQANSGTTTKTLYLVLNDDVNDMKKVTVTSPEGGFEAGKAYTVTVTINGPEAITVTASITDWNDGGNVGVEI